MTCDFESGLCGWLNRQTDDFDWILHSGQSMTQNTGPSMDHTTGQGLYY